MSRRDRMLAMADSMAADHAQRREYIHDQTILLGVLLLSYGVLTWIYGDSLWGGLPVYRTALRVAGAPESWGTMFLLLGIGTIWCAVRRRCRAMIIVCGVSAVVLATFMSMFVTEYIVNGERTAITPAVAYMVFSLSFLARARLAWRIWRSR